MRTKIFLLLFIAFLITDNTHGQAPSWLWAKTAVNSGTLAIKSVGIAKDHFGNTIVAGWFVDNSITLGTVTLVNSSPGAADIFLVKYDPLGNVIWARQAGGPDVDIPSAIGADSSGNIYITGHYFPPGITFDQITLTNSGEFDIFIVKYNANGNVMWAKGAGGSNDDLSYSLSVDPFGSVYLSGSFSSDTMFVESDTLFNEGVTDIYVIKYDSAGNINFSNSYGGNSTETSPTLNTDKNGSVFLACNFLSNNVLIDTITINSGIYLLKFDAALNIQWAKIISDFFAGSITAVTSNTDASGSVYVAGTFGNDSIVFGNITLINTNVSSSDAWLAKFDGAGNVIWANGEGGAGYDIPLSIAAGYSGEVYVAGEFASSSFIFNNDTLVNGGLRDLFLLKYDSGGNRHWAKSAGGNNHEDVGSITVDSTGSLYIAGSFLSPSISFGSAVLLNPGLSNMYVAKLDSLTTSGFHEFESNGSGLLLYPNPVKELLVISYSLLENKDVTINITDISGKIVYSVVSENKTQTEINTKNFPGGIYLVHVQANDFVETKKLIVVK